MGAAIRRFFFKLLFFSVLQVFVFSYTPAAAQGRSPPSSLVEEIRRLTESGRLSLMLQALDVIRSRNIEGVEFGRVMIGINTLLIRLVYPDSPARLPVIDLPQTGSYPRIIREAEKGNYVRPSANSSDFFEHVLPFLAINAQTRPEILSEVLRDLVKAGELRPGSVLPPYFQGIIHERAGRNAQAEAAYRQAYGISNECYPALAGVARMRNRAGNTAEAVAILTDLVTRHPDSTLPKRQLALIYYENRNWSRALPIAEEILLSEPKDGELILIKTHILIEQGHFSQANSTLDTYTSIDANNRNYLFYRARIQAEGQKNRDSALNFLRSILRTDENDPEALMYASKLLMESQRPADVQEGRELLVRLRRNSGYSVDVMVLSLQDAIRRESWEEAQGFLGFVLNSRRTPADLINGYYIERGLKNNAKALSYARELYNLDTTNNDYVVVYISALIDNGRREESLRLVENALNSAGSGNVKSQFYYLRSRLQSREADALSDLRSSIFENPRNLDAIIAMFEIYHKQREERRAVYYLRQALAISPDSPYLKRYEREYSRLLERN